MPPVVDRVFLFSNIASTGRRALFAFCRPLSHLLVLDIWYTPRLKFTQDLITHRDYIRPLFKKGRVRCRPKNNISIYQGRRDRYIQYGDSTTGQDKNNTRPSLFTFLIQRT
jgi:hypothetical protein